MLKKIQYVLAAVTLACLSVTCGSQDDRDKLQNDLGDPTFKEQLGREQYWREYWYYDDLNTPWVYEFRKSSGCGSLQQVYLYSQGPSFRQMIGDTTSAKVVLPRSSTLFGPQ